MGITDVSIKITVTSREEVNVPTQKLVQPYVESSILLHLTICRVTGVPPEGWHDISRCETASMGGCRENHCTLHWPPTQGKSRWGSQYDVGVCGKSPKNAAREPEEALVVTQDCPQGSGTGTAPDHWKGPPG